MCNENLKMIFKNQTKTTSSQLRKKQNLFSLCVIITAIKEELVPTRRFIKSNLCFPFGAANENACRFNHY